MYACIITKMFTDKQLSSITVSDLCVFTNNNFRFGHYTLYLLVFIQLVKIQNPSYYTSRVCIQYPSVVGVQLANYIANILANHAAIPPPPNPHQFSFFFFLPKVYIMPCPVIVQQNLRKISN